MDQQCVYGLLVVVVVAVVVLAVLVTRMVNLEQDIAPVTTSVDRVLSARLALRIDRVCGLSLLNYSELQ